MKGSGAPHACVAGNEILIRTVLRAAENQHLHRSCFLHRRKPKFPPKQSPGERERVATLSHPVVRGGVGEQSAPRSCRRKRNPHPNSPSHRRKSASPPKLFPASSEIQIPAEPSPGERERVATLSHPVARGGVGEQSAPRPCRRKQHLQKDNLLRRKPISPSEHPPGRAREGVNPLDFQSRPATCAAERLLAQRASKSLRDRPSEIEDFGWSPPGADFFGAGACPPEKKSLPCRFRARKSKGFQRNLRKGGAEGNPSPPPPGVLERAAALSTFNLRGGGSGGGACSPVHLTSLLPRPPHKPAPPSTSRASASIFLYTLDSTSTSAEKSIRGMYRDSVSSCSAFAARRQP